LANERIISSDLFSRRVKSLNLRTLSDLSLSERRDGSGKITFGPTNPFAIFSSSTSWPGAGQYAQPAFDLIDRAREVYDVIREAQKAAEEGARSPMGSPSPNLSQRERDIGRGRPGLHASGRGRPVLH